MSKEDLHQVAISVRPPFYGFDNVKKVAVAVLVSPNADRAASRAFTIIEGCLQGAIAAEGKGGQFELSPKQVEKGPSETAYTR